MWNRSPIHYKKPTAVIKYILSLDRLCLLPCFERNLRTEDEWEADYKDSVFKGFPHCIHASCFLIPVSVFYTALINVNQIKVRKTLSALINFEECLCFEESVSETVVCWLLWCFVSPLSFCSCPQQNPQEIPQLNSCVLFNTVVVRGSYSVFSCHIIKLKSRPVIYYFVAVHVSSYFVL